MTSKCSHTWVDVDVRFNVTTFFTFLKALHMTWLAMNMEVTSLGYPYGAPQRAYGIRDSLQIAQCVHHGVLIME